MIHLTGLIKGKDMTIDRLRRIILGAITEKTRNVLENQTQAATAADGQKAGDEQDTASSESDNGSKDGKKRKGRGRNGARDYTGAEREESEVFKPFLKSAPKARSYLFGSGLSGL